MSTLDTQVYLDYAAATPMSEAVFAAMLPYLREEFYNPSSPYEPAVRVRRAYDEAKHRLAQVIGGTADELVMTAGATESINLAFGSINGHVIVPSIEHHAVLGAASRHDHTIVDVDAHGRVHVDAIEAAIRPDTVLISVALANNEIGTVQSIRDIAELVKRVRAERVAVGNRTPLYLHSDASQGAGLLDINVARLGVDMLTLNAGKVYGPKQVGLLWAHRQVALTPQVVGGGQERGLRSGTENVAGTIGFAEALTQAETHRKQETVRVRELRDELQRRLEAAFPEMRVLGNRKHHLPNLLSVSWDGVDAERLIFLLEAQGVYVATGSACAANSGTRSHVLTSIGLTDTEADGSLRMSLGAQTTRDMIDYAVDKITQAVQSEMKRTARA